MKSLETFVLRLVSEPVMIVAGVIIARTLGPSGKGTMAYAAMVLALLATISTGQSLAISWQYGRLKLDSRAVYSAMVRFFAIVVIPVSLVLAVIGAILILLGRKKKPLIGYARD